MAVEVKIPAVGESITSGIVSVWHKMSGDFVNPGDALFTLETDNVSTEIVAETSGVLDAIVLEGQEVKIGEVVATIDDSKKAPEAKPEKKKEAEPSPQSSPKGRGGAEAKTKTKEKSADGETLSPAVRRVVDEEHLDPAKISGTGPGGRITKADALAAAQNRGPVGDAVSVSGKQTASPTGAPEKQSASPTEDRRFDRRHVHRFERRRLRFALEHADIESAANRNSRTAQDHAATGRDRWQSRSAADDVPRAELRSSGDRWQRSGHVSD